MYAMLRPLQPYGRSLGYERTSADVIQARLVATHEIELALDY
jgi:hypothetical protein